VRNVSIDDYENRTPIRRPRATGTGGIEPKIGHQPTERRIPVQLSLLEQLRRCQLTLDQYVRVYIEAIRTYRRGAFLRSFLDRAVSEPLDSPEAGDWWTDLRDRLDEFASDRPDTPEGLEAQFTQQYETAWNELKQITEAVAKTIRQHTGADLQVVKTDVHRATDDLLRILDQLTTRLKDEIEGNLNAVKDHLDRISFQIEQLNRNRRAITREASANIGSRKYDDRLSEVANVDKPTSTSVPIPENLSGREN
jgi:hypothetical protein